MRAILLVASTLLICNAAMAQQQLSPDLARKIAEDMARVQQAVAEARAAEEASAPWPMLGFNTGFEVMVSKKTAPLKAGASTQSRAVSVASIGETYPVIAQSGDWFAVDLGQGGKGDPKSAWLSATDVVPIRGGVVATPPPANPVMLKLSTLALEIKKSYDNNPVLKLGGFSLGTTPPDLTLNFEFK